MNERKVTYIDVGGMSEQEVCKILNIEYVPFYKSWFFWGLALTFSLPSLILMSSLIK